MWDIAYQLHYINYLPTFLKTEVIAREPEEICDVDSAHARR